MSGEGPPVPTHKQVCTLIIGFYSYVHGLVKWRIYRKRRQLCRSSTLLLSWCSILLLRYDSGYEFGSEFSTYRSVLVVTFIGVRRDGG